MTTVGFRPNQSCMEGEGGIMRNVAVFSLCCMLLALSTFALAVQNDPASPPEQSVVIAQAQYLYDSPNGRAVSSYLGLPATYKYGMPVFVRESRDGWSLVARKELAQKVTQGDRGWVPSSSLANPTDYYRMSPPRQVRILVDAHEEHGPPIVFFLNANGHCTGVVASDDEANAVVQTLSKIGIPVDRNFIGCATMWGVPNQRFVLVKLVYPQATIDEQLPMVFFVHEDGHLCGTRTKYYNTFNFVDADGKIVYEWPECEEIGDSVW